MQQVEDLAQFNDASVSASARAREPLGLAGGPVDALWRALTQQRFVQTYFAQLELEFEALCPVGFQHQNADKVERMRAAQRKSPSWTNNHRFEYLVMEGVRPEVLDRRVAIYSERMRTLCGVESSGALGTAFAVPADADAATRRSLALGLLSEVQRLRHVRSEFERLRNRLLVSLLAAGALFGGCAWYLALTSWLPPIAHVFVSGLLGGYFSVLLKLGALRFCLEYNANYHQVDRLFWNMLCSLGLSMFEGAVAALILFTLFLSGVLKGSFFPEFEPITLANVDLSQLFWLVPSRSDEAAKLVVWCVLAGFSERLIPDLLSNLTQRIESNGKPATKQA